MTGDVRCASDQGSITYFLNLYDIIRYKTMTSVDQLQRNLGLTDAALAHDQYTLSEKIEKYAMHAAARCQFDIQPADDLCHKCVGLLRGAQNRHLIFAGKLNQLLVNMKITAKQDARRLCVTLAARHDDLHHLQCVIQSLLLHVGMLDMTDDLNPSGVKIIKEAC